MTNYEAIREVIITGVIILLIFLIIALIPAIRDHIKKKKSKDLKEKKW